MPPHNCCDKKKVRRGLWSPEEDQKLIDYISTYGLGCWSTIPKLAGLQRCGKSCRLRWINYLRPDLKRGNFTPHEATVIIDLHKVLGNKWSQIAKHLPGRTDNEIKNFWHSNLKKKIMADHKKLSGSRQNPANPNDNLEIMQNFQQVENRAMMMNPNLDQGVTLNPQFGHVSNQIPSLQGFDPVEFKPESVMNSSMIPVPSPPLLLDSPVSDWPNLANNPALLDDKNPNYFQTLANVDKNPNYFQTLIDSEESPLVFGAGMPQFNATRMAEFGSSSFGGVSDIYPAMESYKAPTRYPNNVNTIASLIASFTKPAI